MRNVSLFGAGQISYCVPRDLVALVFTKLILACISGYIYQYPNKQQTTIHYGFYGLRTADRRVAGGVQVGRHIILPHASVRYFTFA